MAYPTTIPIAHGILDKSLRQTQRLAQAGKLGRIRKPTRQEREKYHLHATDIILDGDKVRAFKRREDAAKEKRVQTELAELRGKVASLAKALTATKRRAR